MRSTVLRQPDLAFLPDDWRLSTIEDMAETNPEVLGAATPLGFVFRYIDLSAVEKGDIDWPSVREVVFSDAPSRARRLARGGDVLFGTVRPALQSHGAIPAEERRPLVASTGFAVLRARPEEADGRFLFHCVLSDLFSVQARRTEVGSNYPAVNESDVRKFLVPRPEVREQRRIAAILDTLDEAIRRTEQVIAKLQQMKQGLLHDLLTRGVDQHGELRPPPDEAPHLYMDSPFGRIPIGWTVPRLGELAQVTKLAGYEYTSLVHYRSDGEVIAIRPVNIKNEEIELSDIQRISRSVSDKLPRSKVRAGDVVFTYIGAYIGDTALVTESNRFHLAPNIARVSLLGATDAAFLLLRSPTSSRTRPEHPATSIRDRQLRLRVLISTGFRNGRSWSALARTRNAHTVNTLAYFSGVRIPDRCSVQLRGSPSPWSRAGPNTLHLRSRRVHSVTGTNLS